LRCSASQQPPIYQYPEASATLRATALIQITIIAHRSPRLNLPFALA
jgi:hypothetical protein